MALAKKQTQGYVTNYESSMNPGNTTQRNLQKQRNRLPMRILAAWSKGIALGEHKKVLSTPSDVWEEN